MDITIISSNLFLLPQPISVDNKKRIALFVKICLEYNAEFIFLQEVWLNNYVNILKKQLKDYYFIGKTDLLYNKTGLLLFSKYKPLNFKKCSFDQDSRSALYDLLGQKGYIYAQFKIKDKIFDVLNIHLNSPYNGKQIKVWEDQLKSIGRIVGSSNNNMIVAGDFNGSCEQLLKNTSPIYNQSSGLKSFSSDNYYTSRGFHKFAKRFLKPGIDELDLDIDHVLFFPKKTKGKITKRFFLDPLISDHYPIFAKISY